jgi:hypothetical protein
MNAIVKENIKKQNFGCEIEMTGISRKDAAKIISGIVGDGSIGHDYSYDTYFAVDLDGRKWKCMSDSSIDAYGPKVNGRRHHYGKGHSDYCTEFVTPICKYSDIETIQTIIRALVEAGAFANTSCGVHVHVDGANHDAYSITRLANMMLKRQNLINEALQNGYRLNWCQKLNGKLVDAMKKAPMTKADLEPVWYGPLNEGGSRNPRTGYHEHYDMTRYHGLNIHAWYTKGTIEFRLFNGTTHAGKIKAYIQFCLAMSAYAIGAPEFHTALNARFETTDRMTTEQKGKAMMNFLEDRLSLTGKEFETCRLHMTSAFTGAV